MIRHVLRLRGRSFREVVARASQTGSSILERLRLAARAEDPQAWRRSAFVRPAARLNRPTLSSLRGGPEELRQLVRALGTRDPGVVVELRKRSELIQRGELEVLGLGRITAGNPPSWHRDVSSGRIAPKVHWSRIRYLDPSIVGDHKALWEINRHQYLLAPALCWVLDRNAALFDLVQDHLRSWLDENPPQVGVNWASSLEVAYRAISWCWLLWLLGDAPWSDELRSHLLWALERHALHVERYLSLYFSPNTHLTGEALGLFFVGTCLPESTHAARLRARGAEILDAESARQIHPDGVYFEQALQYQRYTTEIYLQYLCLADSTGWSVPTRVRDQLARLCVVLRATANAAGRYPLIGDDDGGALFPVDQTPPDQIGGLLLATATKLSRPELAIPGMVRPAMSYLLCGIQETEGIIGAAPAAHDTDNVYFPYGGLGVMRDGAGAGSAVAVIDAGPHGMLNCGHAHADALAMTLSLGERAVLIDRGTLTYVGPERNEFRSTRSHNTLEIDGESSVTPLGPFQWGPIPPRPVASLNTYGHLVAFDGCATGHVGSGRESFHRRVVIHRPDGAWIVYDEGQRQGAEAACARWQLHPDLMSRRESAILVDILEHSGSAIARLGAPLSSGASVSTREVSLRYGSRLPAEAIELAADARLRVLTILLGADAAGTLPSLRISQPVDKAVSMWTDRTGRHQLTARAQPGLTSADGWETDATLLWLTDSRAAAMPEPFTPDAVFALDATVLEDHGRSLLGEQRGSVSTGLAVFRKKSGDWVGARPNDASEGRA